MAQGYVPSPDERKVLLEMAKQDVHAPHDQIRFLILTEATKRGLLPMSKNSNANVHEPKSA